MGTQVANTSSMGNVDALTESESLKFEVLYFRKLPWILSRDGVRILTCQAKLAANSPTLLRRRDNQPRVAL